MKNPTFDTTVMHHVTLGPVDTWKCTLEANSIQGNIEHIHIRIATQTMINPANDQQPRAVASDHAHKYTMTRQPIVRRCKTSNEELHIYSV